MSDVEVTRHGPVMLIEMTRAEQKNAIEGTLLADLAAAFDEARHDDGVHVVVTTGRGPAFSVGAHLNQLAGKLDLPTHIFLNSSEMGGEKGLEALSENGQRLEQRGVGRWAERMLKLEKPTIAALNGSAAGGGLAIAVLHDYRIASSRAKLTTAWAKLGVGPEMGVTHLLPRIVGHRKAFDLLLRSPVLDAAEAKEIGLVDEVVEPEKVLSRALAFADELAGIPTLAAQLMKRLSRQSAALPLDQMLANEYGAFRLLYEAPHLRAAVEAMQKRVIEGRS